MIREELKDKIFVGVVENNNDPNRFGRVKARVIKVYDELSKENIPWASPFKDLNGNEYNVPDIGKIVSVVFQDGDDKLPEYIYAEHYNINLENKLKALSADDYASFKSIFLDHSTQIYRTNSDGLKIDHEYTNINLDPYGNILLNLRDPKSVITLGSKDADESAVLGDTWMSWFDTLVDNLLGSNGGPYLGNLGAPVIANPSFIDCLQQYKDLRDKFLSNHVKTAKNEQILSQARPYVKQFGDSYTTNVGEVLTTTKPTDYSPQSSYTPSEQLEKNPASIDKNDPSKYASPEFGTLPFIGTASLTQKDAIKYAVAATLSKGEKHGRCSRFTYNTAYNYVNILRGKTPHEGAYLAAGGNARDQGYFNSLKALGYVQTNIGVVNKSTIKSFLSKDYDIGDVVAYYGLDGSSESYAIYGHTQIFNAGIPTGSNGHKWSTDNIQNYSCNFVYNSKGGDSWMLYYFKAPLK
jgi:hypothetical protein